MRGPDRRMIVAVLALAMLGGLLYWRHRREAAIADCLELGGRWEGASSACRMPDNRILTRPGFGRG